MKNGCSIDVFYYFVYSYTNLSLNLVHTSSVFSKCFPSLTQETYKKCVFFSLFHLVVLFRKRASSYSCSKSYFSIDFQ